MTIVSIDGSIESVAELVGVCENDNLGAILIPPVSVNELDRVLSILRLVEEYYQMKSQHIHQSNMVYCLKYKFDEAIDVFCEWIANIPDSREDLQHDLFSLIKICDKTHNQDSLFFNSCSACDRCAGMKVSLEKYGIYDAM